MTSFRSSFAVLGTVLGLLAIILTGRAMVWQAPTVETEAVHSLDLDRQAVADRLGRALSLETISDAEEPVDSSAFFALHQLLQEEFPLVHDSLDRTVINDLSLVYHWEGRDTSKAPILLMAHQDVVPAEHRATWTHPPFSGAVSDGYVWGRGALDNKSGVMGIMEAAEWLLQRGFRPERSVYLAFGHDEEIGGRDGARQIAQHFKDTGTRFQFVLDEGGAITRGAMEQVEQPVAVIGVAEKGYLTVELTSEVPGGHSSAPPSETAINVLTRALHRIEENPLPARLDVAADELLDRIGPILPLTQRLAAANRWLLRPLVARRFAGNSTTAPLVKTTTVTTMIDAGVRDNVLPSSARAVVNFRTLPGDTRETVLDHVRQVVNDERIRIRVREPIMEASPISSTDNSAFRLLERSLHQVSPEDDLLVAPYLVFGATDSRHFVDVADDVYRFAAFTLTRDDRSRIHGVNERIAVDDYARMVRFYVQVLRNG